MDPSDQDMVLCRWFDTQAGQWREKVVDRTYCIEQLHGVPQDPSPNPGAAAPMTSQ
jgi:hypothetical protein